LFQSNLALGNSFFEASQSGQRGTEVGMDGGGFQGEA
jgi:hypothetical protein